MNENHSLKEIERLKDERIVALMYVDSPEIGIQEKSGTIRIYNNTAYAYLSNTPYDLFPKDGETRIKEFVPVGRHIYLPGLYRLIDRIPDEIERETWKDSFIELSMDTQIKLHKELENKYCS